MKFRLSKLGTKMIATLGPSTAAQQTITNLINTGVSILRLNFAHGSYLEHAAQIKSVRLIARKNHRPVGILQDLPGPKVRVGNLHRNGLDLKIGENVYLTSRSGPLGRRTIPIEYPNLHKELKKGEPVYISDGFIRLKVVSVKNKDVLCRVMAGGRVQSGKGVNMPESKLSLKAFTKKDELHLAFGLKQNVDFVGISFVGSAEDVVRVRKFCDKRKAKPFLIAKIERRQALKNLEEILDVADGIMIARGDLGVEIPFYKLPGLQRDIVNLAHEKGVPVIIATQVLESMTKRPRPTRAEATDIANSIAEGADAIMLSDETAVGEFPMEAVEALKSVITAAESRNYHLKINFKVEALSPSEIFSHEVCRLAEKIKADFIVIPTKTGKTSARLSRFRPSMPILALVGDRSLRRRLSLFNSIQTIPIKVHINFENAPRLARQELLRCGAVKKGDRLLLVGGAPFVPVGETGVVQIVNV